MTSRDLVLSVEEGDALKFDSISERCVYLYMRFHADRKGVFRLAMTELAAILNVNRQTVLKHVETLLTKHLLRRHGHGRYVVFANPWTLKAEVVALLDSLKPGDEVYPESICRSLYGRAWDEMFRDVACTDPGCTSSYGDHISEIWDAILEHKGGRVSEDRDGTIRLIR